MIETLNGLDADLLLWFNSCHTPFADSFFWIISAKLTWVPFYLVLAYALFRRYGPKNAFIWLVAAGLTILIADQLCASALRPAFERMRPSNPDNPLSAAVTVVNGYRGGRYGFPSCHAANTWALTALLIPVLRNRWATASLILWAVLNCWSRMYLGVHYPGDILAGTVVGVASGLLVLSATRHYSPVTTGRNNGGHAAVPVALAATIAVIAVISACG